MLQDNLPDEYENSTSEREDMETALLQSLIAAYFNIVRQTIQDVVPKVCPAGHKGGLFRL